MKFEFIKHTDITDKQLEDIALIKSQHWKYPLESQIKWFKENLIESDIHLLMLNGDRLIGYLTITDVELTVDNERINACGLGSVCIDKDFLHKGYATKLVKEASSYISEKEKIGCLLCKENLIRLYGGCCDFIETVSPKILVQSKNFVNTLMILNNKALEEKNYIIRSKTIEINRNF